MEPHFMYRFAADETYSRACLVALGFEGGTPEACAGLQILWTGPFSVVCAPAAGGCDCQFADEQTSDQPAEYSVRDGHIAFSPADVVDYCRAGDSLFESAETDSSVSRVTLRRRAP
jgi:hypothetical protein